MLGTAKMYNVMTGDRAIARTEHVCEMNHQRQVCVCVSVDKGGDALTHRDKLLNAASVRGRRLYHCTLDVC